MNGTHTYSSRHGRHRRSQPQGAKRLPWLVSGMMDEHSESFEPSCPQRSIMERAEPWRASLLIGGDAFVLSKSRPHSTQHTGASPLPIIRHSHHITPTSYCSTFSCLEKDYSCHIIPPAPIKTKAPLCYSFAIPPQFQCA